ncbi:MAG: transcription-repair coupling factor (superfamily II helicase), partial [Gammaproteobacteria bacterium]
MSAALSVLTPTLPSAKARRVHWSGLPGASTSLAIGSAAALHDGPLLVITPSSATALELENELRFFLHDEDLPVLHFPDLETLPYDVFSPHQDIISERLAALDFLPRAERGILVVPITTLVGRIAPRAYVAPNSFMLQVGDKLDIDAVRLQFDAAGYRAVGQVMEHGEFAVRGSLLDLYPMGTRAPYRIDLFDDEVDSIREFDPESQRSERTVGEIRILPAREFPLDEEGIARFRQRWRAGFEGDPMTCPIYRDVSEGHSPAGIEYYLPLFHDTTETLFDYVPAGTLVVEMPHVDEAASAFWNDVVERHEQRRHDVERPILAPEALYLTPEQLAESMSAFPRASIGNFAQAPQDRTVAARRGYFEFATASPPALPIDIRAQEPLKVAQQWLSRFEGRVLFAAETAGRQEALIETFSRHGVRLHRVDSWAAFRDGEQALAVVVAALDTGALLEQPALAIVTESQLFGERVAQRRRRKTSKRDAEAVLRDLTELTIGSPVVHEDHGIGRYVGLQTLSVGGNSAEFLTLEYDGGDKLYVPVLSLHLISRYSGADPEHAPIHRLGSGHWQKARKKAAERVRDVAAEL